jgi:hypothetical protein
MKFGNLSEQAERRRRKSVECRELAATFSGSGMRDSMFEMADAYEAIAADMEARVDV